MAINRDAVGKVYPPSAPYLVGREKIREFAIAIGDQNPAYHDVAAAKALGHADVIAPPTFPFAITMKALAVAMFDPDLDLNYALVVHGEQEFTYSRPLTAGDEVIVTSSIADITARGKNEYVTTIAELNTVDGEHIVSTKAVLVSRGTAPEAS